MNNVYIGKSSLHGKGLFASRDIKKGQTIFIVKGRVIERLITDNKKALKANWNWFGFGKNKWIETRSDYSNYFNHSCNPNTVVSGRVRIVALYDIKMNDEITFDYSTNEADIFWSIKCHCGNKNCRKTIKSIQFLPEDTYNKYLPFIPLYFQSVFRNFKVSNFSSRNKFIEKWVLFLKSNK